MKAFCKGSLFVFWHLWTCPPLLGNSAIINYESMTSFPKRTVWLHRPSPLLSLWDHDHSTNSVLAFNELGKFFLLLSLVYPKDAFIRVKSYLDEAIYCAPAAELYEKYPHHFLCGFEAFLWNGQTAQPCFTFRELMIMQKKNLMIAKIATARITKFWIRTFCSGFIIGLLCSYLRSSSSSVFSFSLLPRGSQLIFPASNFHAITRCFVLIQDELNGFYGKLFNSPGHIII